MTSTRGRIRLLMRRVKRTAESWSYEVFDRLALFGMQVTCQPDVVAVAHLERIGDYVLWRPHGVALVARLREQSTQIVLLIESDLKELALQDFPECEVIELSRRRLLRNAAYRWKAVRALRQVRPMHTYVPSCPRDSVVHDALVRALGAPATGFAAGFADDQAVMSARSRRLYARLVAPLSGAHIDDQHRAFLGALGIEPATQPVPRPSRPRAAESLRYWILAPGASQDKRRWPAQRFVAMARMLACEAEPRVCVLLGGPEERILCRDIAESMQTPCIDLAGRTSVGEMQQWIAHAEFILGNDSAAGHFAAAMGVPAIIVTGGGHYGRCFPYTAQITPARCRPIAVAEPMPCFHCDWICQYATAPNEPYPCIERITIGQVHAALKEARCKPLEGCAAKFDDAPLPPA